LKWIDVLSEDTKNRMAALAERAQEARDSGLTICPPQD